MNGLCFLNPCLVPRQPSACGACGHPEHLHTGAEFRPVPWTLCCAVYVPPGQWLILKRMRHRRQWPPVQRWNVGRSSDR